MQKILLLIGLVLSAFTATAQVIYVDADAGGNNDGTSWTDAYTDLGIAINNAEAGSSLWIAGGRYVTPDTAAFFIDRELSLYGGFDGSETSVEEADPVTNPTILSGDVMGNDNGTVYDSTLAADNNRVLIIIDTSEVTSSFTVTLDGLTIRDGAVAADYEEGSPIPFAGGGLYSEARTDISRVTFTANRAPFGSASAHIFTTGSQSTFDNVVSEGNYSGIRGNHYFNSVDSISFTNSTFSGSTDVVVDGGFISTVAMTGLTIDGCSFSDLNGGDVVRGGALNTASTLDIRIMNSDFSNLSADLGGALYLRNPNLYLADRETNAEECVIDNCTFTDINAQRWGGAAFFGNISHTISNSTFTDGIGAQTGGLGGAVYGQSGDTIRYAYHIDNTDFIRNTTSGSSGGAIFYFADGVDVKITGSRFEGNIAAGNAGAIFLQGSSTDRVTASMIDNCEFVGNTAGAGFAAAALLLFEKSTVSNSSFMENSATNGSLYVGAGGKAYHVVNSEFTNNGSSTNSTFARGAGIWAGLSGGNLGDSVVVDSCTFSGNVVSGDDFISGGSAIYVSGDTGPMVPSFRVMNSSFVNNASTNDADAAIEVINGTNLEVINSDFFANSSSGNGGAINMWQLPERDTLDNVPFTFYLPDNLPTLTVERSLFVNNNAGVQGGAINLFSSTIDMRNSIMLGNTVDNGEGSGGGIIINGSSSPGAVLDNYLINNTFYNNRDGGRIGIDTLPGSVGNAVAIFQPGNTDADSNAVVLTIQNNAFFMDAPQEESIGLELNTGDVSDPTGFGAITVNSLGGNYFSSSLAANLPFTDVSGEDIVNVEVDLEDIFVDPFESDPNSDFPNVNLVDSETNVLINGGTTGDLVPEVDFYNRTRIGLPDIGAIELDTTSTSVAEPISQSGLALEFFPNPTVDVVNIVNHDPAIRDFTVLVSDMQGRFVGGRQFGAVNNKLDVSGLPKGVYNLTLLINGKVYSQQIMRQ
ncbi:T9SS type A sorting domain-containing protein [Neolewinella litorea]|uniref:T9SS type A sorting domain-containing protein n=1 Tax=Neolewinella litorea TaxID=2562452 RepID=A0A4S4NG76_9BACT|nr:T9SS type A sorting domain-containing protein [Neolewinella litorea]THH37647.1 T9SS type A sorting domain-containing protein [Neolewinella litorea]